MKRRIFQLLFISPTDLHMLSFVQCYLEVPCFVWICSFKFFKGTEVFLKELSQGIWIQESKKSEGAVTMQKQKVRVGLGEADLES